MNGKKISKKKWVINVNGRVFRTDKEEFLSDALVGTMNIIQSLPELPERYMITIQPVKEREDK